MIKIFPAIDLLNGNCVRLVKGDYSKSTVYSTTVIEVAKTFELNGAAYLHIVDLNGAKSGVPTNFDVIRSITMNTNLFVEVGGGIRCTETVKSYFGLGIDRVIIGTAAISDFNFLEAITSEYPNQVNIALDCIGDDVRTQGWQTSGGVNVYHYLEDIKDLPIGSVIATDIDKDGMLQGPAFSFYERLKASTDFEIIASGGISSVEDIKKLDELGVEGAIVGKALYEGRISLHEILNIV
jgi:phosphoribosylformimino-5-aminoimidazole carboxamide ribotide isomerase